MYVPFGSSIREPVLLGAAINRQEPACSFLDSQFHTILSCGLSIMDYPEISGNLGGFWQVSRFFVTYEKKFLEISSRFPYNPSRTTR